VTAGSPKFQDARGCLTAEGLSALERAPPGRAPADLANHLAGCDRCQQRWLSRLRTETGSKAERPRRGSPWRNLALALAALILLLAGLFLLTSLG
jgi:hypothetical protein